MPKMLHNRAMLIMRKNPKMPESEAWAIATKQMKKKKQLKMLHKK